MYLTYSQLIVERDFTSIGFSTAFLQDFHQLCIMISFSLSWQPQIFHYNSCYSFLLAKIPIIFHFPNKTFCKVSFLFNFLKSILFTNRIS